MIYTVRTIFYLAVEKFAGAAAAQIFIAISLDESEQVVVGAMNHRMPFGLPREIGGPKEPEMSISYWSPRLAVPPYGIQQKRPNL